MIKTESDLDGEVVTVVLDRPATRNALNVPLLRGLATALHRAAARPRTRLVVLAASGSAFSAGADLRNPLGSDFPDAMAAVLDALQQVPVPVLCRLEGPVRAGGIGLVAACDVVLAVPEATLAFSEVRFGVVPAFVAVLALRSMARRPLQELILSGRTFDAAEAFAAGLVTRVVPAAAMDEEVDRVADALRRCERGAVGRAKALLRELGDLTVDDGFERVRGMSVRQFAAPEARAAVAAFGRVDPAVDPGQSADPTGAK